MGIDLVPFRVSLLLALWTTGILLVVSFPLAWVFARSGRRWIPYVESFFSIPLVLPPTVLGFYILIVLSPSSFIGAGFQRLFGTRLAFSFTGLVIASCISGFPFMLTSLRNGIIAVPGNLLDAAYTLGKGRLETAVRIVLPNMRPAVLAGLVMTFAHTLGEFGVVLMIGGSIPGATKVVSIAIYERVEAQDFRAAHVYALILVVASYAGVLLLNRLQRRERRARG
jgi:molybdate transport system permease protein